MNLIGLRVVRGPGWKYEDQDGGEGHVGTITMPEKLASEYIPEGIVFVAWDCGVIANYSVGDDLLVLDNAPAGTRHIFVTCDICLQNGVMGFRWKCMQCNDFDLCSECYMSDQHHAAHTFIRYDTPVSSGVELPARENAAKLEAKGTFVGATVVRGCDWRWGDQDGGKGLEGTVTKISGKEEGSWRSILDVTWANGTSNKYRLGVDGKIDLFCAKEATGGHFYKDHLPTLDKYAPSPFGFLVGDRVKISVDAETLEVIQSSDDKWDPNMVQFIGKIGTVVRLQHISDIMVHFPPKSLVSFKADALVKLPLIKAGDTVQVLSDRAEVERLQDGHGGWVNQMEGALGRKGKVIHIHPTGDIRILVRGHPWTLNPECLTFVSRNDQTDEDSDEDDSSDSVLQVQGLFDGLLSSLAEDDTQSYDPDNLIQQCERGNTAAVKQLLEKQPDLVNTLLGGKRPLQAASFKGNSEIVELLLESGAKLDLVDERGDSALHLAAAGDEILIIDRPDIMQRLIKAGIDINQKNKVGFTALHMATNFGHRKCVEVLLENGCDINLKDSTGDSALHDAIIKGHGDIFDILIEQENFIQDQRNNKSFTILHQAVFNGNTSFTQKILEKASQLVNLTTGDGHSALHIAAVNGYREVAQILLDQGNIDVNLSNNRKHTALMLAVSEGRASIIELLVSKGALIDETDQRGMTCLHLALEEHSSLHFSALLPSFRKTQPRELDQAPSIAKICLDLPPSIEDRAWVGIACFIAQHGGDINREDSRGKSPLSLAKSPVVVSVLQEYARKYSEQSAEECMMCAEFPAVVTFQPCGHKSVCQECSIRMKKCFVCHVAITDKIYSATPTSPKPFPALNSGDPGSNKSMQDQSQCDIGSDVDAASIRNPKSAESQSGNSNSSQSLSSRQTSPEEKCDIS